MKNMAQVEPSAWSLAEEAPEVTDLGSLRTPVTKKAPPGVMGRAALVPGRRLQPSLAAESTEEPRWYPPVKGRSLTEVCVASTLLQRRQWHPTPVLLPGKSQGRGSLVGCRLWGRTESDTTETT